MTVAVAPRRPPSLQLWAAAAVAWVAVVGLVRAMRPMSGTVPGLGTFLLMWVPMMAAMMLPSVEPVASLYARAVRTGRGRRLTAFAGGYLAAWAAVGLPVFGMVLGGGWLADHHPGGATALAAVVFAGAGVYQLTPLKQRCLSRCRSPLGQLLHYGSFRGPLRDLRVGLHHAGWCVGCCWALMALMIAFGTMNLYAMAGLAIVVFVEKRWPVGVPVGRAVGFACLALAVAVVLAPQLAPALHHGGMAMTG